jgi:hypothetical protein
MEPTTTEYARVMAYAATAAIVIIRALFVLASA